MIIATKKGIVSEIMDAIPLILFQTAQQRRQNRHDGQGNQQRTPDVVRLRQDWPLPCAFGSKRLIRWALLLSRVAIALLMADRSSAVILSGLARPIR